MSIGQHYTDDQCEAAIEEMMGQQRYMQDFFFHGPDLEQLVALVMSRGLPLRDRTASDDRLIDSYEAVRDQLRTEFTNFAHIQVTDGKGGSRSRVERYIDYHRQLPEAA